MFIKGPGAADVSYTSQRDGTSTPAVSRPHQDLTTNDTIIGHQVDDVPHEDRIVGTVVLGVGTPAS